MAYLRMTIVIALTRLPDSSRKDARWVRSAWFAHKAPSFFDAITAEETKRVRPERNSRLMRSPFLTPLKPFGNRIVAGCSNVSE